MKKMPLVDACRAIGEHNSKVRWAIKRNPGVGYFDDQRGTWFVTDINALQEAIHKSTAGDEFVSENSSRAKLITFLDSDKYLRIRREFLNIDAEIELLAIASEMSEEVKSALDQAKKSIQPLSGKLG